MRVMNVHAGSSIFCFYTVILGVGAIFLDFDIINGVDIKGHDPVIGVNAVFALDPAAPFGRHRLWADGARRCHFFLRTG